MEVVASGRLTATVHWSRGNRCPWRHWPKQQQDSLAFWMATTVITSF